MGVIPEALDLPPGSQPWKRSVDAGLSDLQKNSDRALQDANNQIMALANTVKTLGEQITVMPALQILGAKRDSFGVNATWISYAGLQFTVPTTKSHARILVVANAEVLDTTTGGVGTLLGRINLGGVASYTSSAAKDAGSASVNNVLSASYYFDLDLIPGAIYKISLELCSSDPTAFPAQSRNYAAVTASITHTG